VVRGRPTKRSADTRVNARLDPETSRLIGEIQKTTGMSVTDAIKRSIRVLHEQVCGDRDTSTLEVFRAAGLVGCVEAPADLSSTYKKRLRDGLAGKHGKRD
jgi:hypothetical protein